MKQFCTRLLVLLTLILSTQLIAANTPTKVIVAPVENQTLKDQVEALGTLNANESVELMSTVTERVKAIHFTDAQRIKKGTLLLEMKIEEELALLDEQNAILKEAQKQVQRYIPLVAKGAVPKTNLDTARLEVSKANARINAIKSQIEERRIIAPFDGIIGLRNISVGAMLRSDTAIATIHDDSVMKLDFSLPSLFLSFLEPGIKIRAKTDAFSQKVFYGEISQINNQVDPVTRTIRVRAIIDNVGHGLKSGLLMQIVLETNVRKALVIPEEALIPNGDKNFVLVVIEKEKFKTVEKRLVKTGVRQPGKVEVLSGLLAEDLVVIHGTMKAKPGKPVMIQAIQRDDNPLQEREEKNIQ
ncbi:efflux RND transporter periplasmic adaptor subunit [Sulfurovum sp.]|uniref:efflux RND transporter periplasmic adaptor subunit n=1 Tax=Sulfurovum sp. TaxID=1969726 RepID=UPI002867F9C9|nr:efflux RND transporter periplasmic adaptor subunit [Sulfurovum sp.]